MYDSLRMTILFFVFEFQNDQSQIKPYSKGTPDIRIQRTYSPPHHIFSPIFFTRTVLLPLLLVNNISHQFKVCASQGLSVSSSSLPCRIIPDTRHTYAVGIMWYRLLACRRAGENQNLKKGCGKGCLWLPAVF
jgi:hypothetical protein